jgi:hypothetical protein
VRVVYRHYRHRLTFRSRPTPQENFTTTSNNGFVGGGQVGINYEFWGGVGC